MTFFSQILYPSKKTNGDSETVDEEGRRVQGNSSYLLDGDEEDEDDEDKILGEHFLQNTSCLTLHQEKLKSNLPKYQVVYTFQTIMKQRHSPLAKICKSCSMFSLTNVIRIARFVSFLYYGIEIG